MTMLQGFGARGKRWTRSLACLLATLMVAAACSGLPQRGEVQVVPQSETQSGGVVLDPKGPTPGATPTDLVDAFLRASSVGASDDYQVARQFLTPEAAARWNPGAKVSVYSDSQSAVLSQATDGAIHLSVPALAVVDSEGRYTQSPEKSSISSEFSLIRDHEGEWRIAQLSDGVIMAQSVFESLYLKSSLYFLNNTNTAYVTELRWFPRSRVLSLLAASLLKGPSEWLKDAAHSALTGDGSARSVSVVVDGEIALVDMSESVASLSDAELSALEGQFTKTLAATGLVSQIRLTVEGALVREVPVADLPAYPYTATEVVGIQDSRLVRPNPNGQTVTLSDAAWGDLGITSLAVPYTTPSMTMVALGNKNHTLYRLDTTNGESEVILEGDRVAVPSIDASDWVWSASTSSPGEIVAAPTTGGPWVHLRVPDLEDSKILKLAVSREGSRLVVLATRDNEPYLYTFGISREQSGAPRSLGTALRIGQRFRSVTDFAWVGESRLVVLGATSENGIMEMHALDIGGPRESIAAVPNGAWIAAGRGMDSVIVTSSNGDAQRYSGGSWSEFATAVTALTYPG